MSTSREDLDQHIEGIPVPIPDRFCCAPPVEYVFALVSTSDRAILAAITDCLIPGECQKLGTVSLTNVALVVHELLYRVPVRLHPSYIWQSVPYHGTPQES